MKFWTCQHIGQNNSHFKTLFQMRSLVADDITISATQTFIHAHIFKHTHAHTIADLLHDS